MLARRLAVGMALAAALASVAQVAAAPTMDSAVRYYRSKQYAEAKLALGQITAAEPGNAAACYFLGMSEYRAGGPGSLDRAAPWLQKAVKLEPGNETYLADFGGVTLECADAHHSLTEATRGRNALVQAISMNPGDLAARDGLLQFYARAPWPLGDDEKARAEADAIAARDPKRGARTYALLGKLLEKKGHRASAHSAYEAVLKLNPDDPGATAGLARLSSP